MPEILPAESPAAVLPVSAVVLNWTRPGNLRRVVAELKAAGVDQVLVWNNNPAAKLGAVDGCDGLIESDRDLGLHTRFAAACLCRHDAVLIQDDDLLLSRVTIARLHAAWLAEPEILHGIFGREPRPSGSYALELLGDVDAPIILTRALICRRDYFGEFFRHVSRFARIQADGQPHGNGEDIILSYVVRKVTGRLHRLHALPVRELSKPEAISMRWSGHWPYRSRLLRECELWLQE